MSIRTGARASERQRRERMRHDARRLHAAGRRKPRLDLEWTTDVLWTFSSVELYELLVVKCGWSIDRCGTFAAESMISAVFGDSVGPAR